MCTNIWSALRSHSYSGTVTVEKDELAIGSKDMEENYDRVKNT
jgi:hypothetical protein